MNSFIHFYWFTLACLFFGILTPGIWSEGQPGCLPSSLCGPNQFQCKNCRCILNSWLCNHANDCGDGSDEHSNCTYPSCSPHEFTCKNKRCVDQSWVCDGNDDCTDASDEAGCQKTSCPSWQWTCPNSGKCIPISKACDGTNDCADGSDEISSCSDSRCSWLSCGHNCQKTPSGGQCSCAVGMTINLADNRTCIDFNECSSWGYCDQKCKNKAGSYECSCYDGFTKKDNKHCAVNSSQSMLLLVGTEKRIFSIDSTGKNLKVKESTSVLDIEVNYAKNKMYWIDNKGRILEADIDSGHNNTTLPIVGHIMPYRLALDWVTNTLYFSDKYRRIAIYCLDTGYQRGIITDDINEPSGLAIDPTAGFLFFSDPRTTLRTLGRIVRTFMDGSHRMVLRLDKIQNPIYLTLDIVNQRIYWIDYYLDYIETADYYGKFRHTILSGSLNIPAPVSLSLFENQVFWADNTKMGILKVNKYNGLSSVSQLFRNTEEEKVKTLKVFHSSSQKESNNPCKKANCEQICVLTHTSENAGLGYKCMCQSGYEVMENKINCTKIDKFLLFVCHYAVRGISLTSNSANAVDAITPLIAPGRYRAGRYRASFVAVDYTASDETIYFSDISDRIIYKGHLNGTGVVPLVTNDLGAVEGIAVNWISRNLYFTDNRKGTISVIRIDHPEDRRVLISDIGNARAICIHPLLGFIFYSDWLRNDMQNAYIARAKLDGTNIVRIRQHEMGWPNGLSIDYADSRLYWVDAYFDRIQHSDFSGQDVQTLSGVTLPHPFGIAVYNGSIYVTDWRLNSLLRMDKNGHGVTVIRKLDYMRDIKIYDKNLQYNGHTTCVRRNGDCSHFCFPPCGCPYGMKLDKNHRDCVTNPEEGPKPICPEGLFQCANKRCIQPYYKCDGENNCIDNSDESDCPADRTCPADNFQCNDGMCISKHWVCDGDFDCRDKSDERNCTTNKVCSDREFTCNNSICISLLFKCNSENDCGDGSDEGPFCAQHTCLPGYFLCGNKICISERAICDGDNDCFDHSDEKDCSPVNCTETQWPCKSQHQCIDINDHCNGIFNCGDESDEADCPELAGECHSSEFKCTEGGCIPATWQCDGKQDCEDGSDESATCPPTVCPNDRFLCNNSRCIVKSWTCDGEDDCGDGSDEDKELTCPPPPFSCPYGQWECPGGSRTCIPDAKVCDGNPDCPRGHDESSLCNTDSCLINNGDCSNICLQTPMGAQCQCPMGEELNGTKICMDKNECEPPGHCSQKCENTIGSFKCKCDAGYEMLSDRRTCRILRNESAPYLIVLGWSQLIHKSLDDDKFTTVYYLDEHYHRYRAIDADVRSSTLYLVESRDEQILQVKMDPFSVKTVIRGGIHYLGDLAVDWIGRNVYWTNADGNSIDVATLDGKYRNVLYQHKAGRPYKIVLDPREGSRVMFWTYQTSEVYIARAGMDGSNKINIVSDKIHRVTAIVIDYPNKYLYFIDSQMEFIDFCDYDGNHRRRVLSSFNLVKYPTGVTVIEDRLYWVDARTDMTYHCNKFTCENKDIVTTRISHVRDIIAYSNASQPSSSNPCFQSPCSHLCLLSPENPGYKCACPLWMNLGSDGTNCVISKSEFLLYVDYGIVPLPWDNRTKSSIVGVASFMHIIDFDYDSEKSFIYYLYQHDHYTNLKKISFDGLNSSVIWTNRNRKREANGIAIDWISRNLFWFRASKSFIGVMKLDGEAQYNRRILANNDKITGVFSPYSICLDPVKGFVYWVDLGGGHVPKKIAEAKMDGSGSRILIQDNLNKPSYLTKDPSAPILYWSEGYLGKIERYDISRKHREVVLENLDNPKGLAVFKGVLSYAQADRRTISRIALSALENGGVKLPAWIYDISGVKVFYARHLSNETNQCAGSNYGGCSQLCVPVGLNTKKCECNTGLTENAQGVCEAGTSILIAVVQNSLVGFSLDSSDYPEAMAPYEMKYGRNTYSTHIVPYVKGNYIYAVGYNHGLVRFRPDGSKVETLIERSVHNRIMDISLDWLAGNLYMRYYDHVSEFLVVCRLDGSHQLVLVDNIRSFYGRMCINPIKRYIYWTSLRPSKIVRANLDGSNLTVLVKTGIINPRGITVDIVTHYVYWADTDVDSLQRMSYSGGNREYVRSNLPNPFGVAVLGNNVYWSDKNLKKIFTVPKNSKVGAPSTVKTRLQSVSSIVIFDLANQPTVSNPCTENNGGCEQLCFSLPNNSTALCKCNTGQLGPDGHSCVAPVEFLIYAFGSEVKGAFLDPGVHSQPIPAIKGLKNPISVDYDYEEKFIYFSQITSKTLSRVKKGSTRVEDIVYMPNTSNSNITGVPEDSKYADAPIGLAVDWVGKKLYWTDSLYRRIVAMTFESTLKVTLAHVVKPRAIALNPCKGYMYWTTVNPKRPMIERATMAGNQRTAIITSGLSMPTGLAIDYQDEKLYWADSALNKIERSNLDGNYREVIVDITAKPFALTVFGNYIYWSDSRYPYSGSIMRAEKHTGNNQQIVVKRIPSHAKEIKIYSEKLQTCSNDPCQIFNGGCSHLCHPAPDGKAECSCADDSGLVLANNQKMCVPQENNCTAMHFICMSGKCIYKRWICDIDDDCGDGSDENPNMCADHTCDPSMYRCDNGRCIRPYLRCDYDNDCRDNSDERDCGHPTCGPNEFECKSFRCINQRHVCDGYDHCRDGFQSDEQNCPNNVTCRPGEVKCPNNNICLFTRYLCDGDNDCGDNSDENRMFCQSVTCSPEDFSCSNQHRCIPAAWHCDGFDDCGDNQDEPPTCGQLNQTCPGNFFKCDNGQCIAPMWVCDGDNDCLDGSDEDEELSCSDRTCPPSYFTCKSNIRSGMSPCISHRYVCDGNKNCMDGEDELQSCPPRTCSEDQFVCDNGLCIKGVFQCDHDNDCGDNSDEPSTCVFPKCRNDQFTCDNQQCIPRRWVCDTDNDCRDNSDEKISMCFTPAPTCPPGQFLCKNGECINYSIVCNKIHDCSDGSDELHCNINECADTEINQCEHNCVDTITSFHCDCNSGYSLMNDKKACKDIDECKETPEVCSQQCLNTEGNFTCKCNDGYLKENGRVCKRKDNITPWLIFSNRYYIRELSTDGQIYRRVSQDFDMVRVLDYDYKEQRLYYIDLHASHIQRMFLNGTNKETIVKDRVPYGVGLAVDWVGRKLYWVDSVYASLFVCELNGTNRAIVLSRTNQYKKGLSQPRAIVVDPSRGYLYWTDLGFTPCIGRIGMDGSGYTILVTEKIQYPNGLTIEHETNRLWWADAHLDYIEYCNADGTNRHTVIQEGVPHIFAITLFEDSVYWTDWHHKSIEKANKYTGKDRVMLKNTTHRPAGIHVVHPLRQKSYPNPCGANNGGCSHLCLLAPGNTYTCVCPTDFLLRPDNRTCIANCSDSQFRCGDRCIPLLWKCDGKEDCKDGSDEPDSCPPRICSPGQFRCKNSNCTYSFGVCDQHDDCGDGSDEENCDKHQCLSWQWKCKNNKCISLSWMCDEEDDCGDASDELPEKCVNTTCAPSQFTCANGACISMSWKCDSIEDCIDGSDESPIMNCANLTCPSSQFKCATNFQCIPKSYLCDGDNDCQDKSDEEVKYCEPCNPEKEFQCDNNVCIPLRWVCDYDNDCRDGSDEKHSLCVDKYRPCSESEFRCSNQICISNKWRCDYDNDCGDGSDEANCGKITCPANKFRCNSGHCILQSAVCDRRTDCTDLSDERNCTAPYPNGKYCASGVFECKNTMCIPLKWRCDGTDDCGDASDEVVSVCKVIDCPDKTHYRCNNFKCIPRWRLCDKVDNCGDASDENNQELCQPVKKRCEANQFKCANQQCIDSSKVCDEFKDCKDSSDEQGCHKTSGMVNCSVSNGGCIHNCTDLKQGGFYCSCREGYKVSTTNRKECDDVDECAQWGTNHCPQICNNVKGSYKCTCATGFVQYSNRCRSTSYVGICLTMGSEIRMLGHKKYKYTEFASSDRPQALAFNQKHSTIYWTDLTSKSIHWNYIPTPPANPGKDVKLNIFGLQEPNGISLDWISGNIYWTDTKKKTISIAAFDGRYSRTLIKNGLRKPFAIVINSNIGWMYWTDVDSERPTIERAWLDGENREELVNERLASPTGITIDYFKDNRIFWCDAKFNHIESMKPDGTDRVIVVKGLQNPVSLDVFEMYIYFLSKRTGTLQRVDKFGRDGNVTFMSGLLLPRSLKVFTELKVNQDVKSDCLRKTTCSHLCIPLHDGHICACPDNSKLLPGSDSLCDAASEVAVDLSHCNCQNGGTCVQAGKNTYKCNCQAGFYGRDCTSLTPEKLIGQLSHTKVAAVVVPVVLLLIIAAVAVGGCFVMKKRGKFFLNKPSIGDPSVPHTPLGVVSFRDGDDVNIGTPPLSYDITSGQVINPLENEYSTAEPTCPTNFSNPMYGVDSPSKQRQKKAPSPPSKQSLSNLDKNESKSSEKTIDSSKKTSEAKSKKENYYVSLKTDRAFDPTEDTDTDTAGLVKMGEH